jgi:hypothetical protein
VPTGDRELFLRSTGVQVNLPFSKQHGDLYFHWNGGFTWYPSAKASPGQTTVVPDSTSLFSPQVAGSGIYRVRQMFNLMLEGVVTWEEVPLIDGSTARETVFTLSPGARGGWDVGDHQLIIGAALPITWVSSDTSAGVLLYFSYELPFRR